MLAFASVLGFLHNLVLGVTTWDFDIDVTAIAADAQAILVQFMPIVLMVMGISLGFKIYKKAKSGGV